MLLYNRQNKKAFEVWVALLCFDDTYPSIYSIIHPTICTCTVTQIQMSVSVLHCISFFKPISVPFCQKSLHSISSVMIKQSAMVCRTGMPCQRKTFNTFTVRNQDVRFSVCRGEDRGRTVGKGRMLAEVHTSERQFDFKLDLNQVQYQKPLLGEGRQLLVH